MAKAVRPRSLGWSHYMCDAASRLTGEAHVPKPIVLTENDFADHEQLRGHDGFVLILAHTNLLDEKAAAPDDH
jgi:hypothetical protein